MIDTDAVQAAINAVVIVAGVAMVIVAWTLAAWRHSTRQAEPAPANEPTREPVQV
ncbi:hypothetical protein OHA25_41200 [Nonomuraea sp. NBC_00507]|uniref:hypothetical protein n=1 Tax=Nonomuraea sp. NBC_00507 TaxID=2976002 RepID=UPI002E16F713